ncbi:MAG TPA: L,D-transpeptidase [Blastocatellia bacterium]|nr:L,D-transpeptidase [Blastocatellia bacterium]
MKSRSRIATSTAAVTALLLTFGLTYPEWSSDTPLYESHVEASTIVEDQPETPAPPAPKPVQYVSFKLDGKQSIAQLKSRLGEEGFLTVLKINRVDPANLRKGTELMVPAEGGDPLEFSPFPRSIEVVKDIPKLILVSRRVQAFGAYEDGKLVWWGPTSTGKKATQTPAGLFHTNWRAKVTRSTVNSNWVLPWTFNLDNFDGIAFHQYALPGYPASHGCVRLLESDAKWVYGWSDQWVLSTPEKRLLANGTPVIIFDNYAFGQQPPWKQLSADATAASVTIAEIQKQLDKHLPAIEARAHEREMVMATMAEAKAK